MLAPPPHAPPPTPTICSSDRQQLSMSYVLLLQASCYVQSEICFRCDELASCYVQSEICFIIVQCMQSEICFIVAQCMQSENMFFVAQCKEDLELGCKKAAKKKNRKKNTRPTGPSVLTTQQSACCTISTNRKVCERPLAFDILKAVF